MTNAVAAVRIVVLAHLRDLEEWIGQGWTAAMVPVHPVQRAYGRCYVWRWA